MKILVTGGAGFMGSHVAEELLKEGHEVIALDDLSGGFEENVPKDATFVKGSINDIDLVNHLTKDTDIIFHLAAYAAEGLSHFIKKFNYENNLMGSVNLINAAIKNNVKTFLFTSSMAVYGTNVTPMKEDMVCVPEDPYGIAKLAVEKELKVSKEMFGLNYIIIRPHNVYGEKQNLSDPYRNVIGIFMNQIMNNKPPTIFGDGTQTRAFSYIKDVAPYIAKAPFIKEALGEIINICAEKECTIKELANEVLEAFNSDLKPAHLQERYEVKHAFCDHTKAKKILGFKSKYDLKEGIKNMAEWAKKKGPQELKRWDTFEIHKNMPEFWLKK